MTNAFRKKYQICMFPYDVCHSNHNIQYNLRKGHKTYIEDEWFQNLSLKDNHLQLLHAPRHVIMHLKIRAAWQQEFYLLLLPSPQHIHNGAECHLVVAHHNEPYSSYKELP